MRGTAWIARLSNERRALEPLIALSSELQWTELKFQSRVSMRRALRLTLGKALDHGSPDLHRFVAVGLIYRSDVDPDLDQVLHFYQRPHWHQTLRTFANIDQDESAVLAETLNVIASTKK